MKGSYWMAGQGQGYDYREIDKEDVLMGKAYYYKMVEMVDESIGDIVRILEERNLIENTIIIFTSDHGELLGDHRIWMKGPFHYEQIINVPLLIQWKEKLPSNYKIDSIE